VERRVAIGVPLYTSSLYWSVVKSPRKAVCFVVDVQGVLLRSKVMVLGTVFDWSAQQRLERMHLSN
jgi:hypothetical protein